MSGCWHVDAAAAGESPECGRDAVRLEQLPAAYAFLLTWGTVPSIYYGDAIGMRYLPGLPDLEGSVCHPGYNRAGCRTPMQWDDALTNAGFSDAAPELIYLPQDPDPHRPTVAAQLDEPRSLLHTVRRLLALRASHPALGVGSDQQVLSDVPVHPHARWHPPCRGQPPPRTRLGRGRRDHRPTGRAARRLKGRGDGRVSADGFGWAIFTLR
jgi:alpha-glucosidase